VWSCQPDKLERSSGSGDSSAPSTDVMTSVPDTSVQQVDTACSETSSSTVESSLYEISLVKVMAVDSKGSRSPEDVISYRRT